MRGMINLRKELKIDDSVTMNLFKGSGAKLPRIIPMMIPISSFGTRPNFLAPILDDLHIGKYFDAETT
jgi:hypothetical protein